MPSVLMIFGLFVVGFLFTTVLISQAARAAGTTRKGILAGSLVLAVVTIVNLVLNGFALLVPKSQPVGTLVVSLMCLIVALVLPFKLFKWFYGLNGSRAFAPWGAYVAAQVLGLVFAQWVFRPYLCEAFLMPTPSMSPTIMQKDRILVNRRSVPKRWDVIAYVTSDQPGKVVYLKRIIGLPGERLRFEHGSLFVNDQVTTAPSVLAGRLSAGYPESLHVPARYREGETITLGPEEMFVIGDNVEQSNDSRLIGPERYSAILGKADAIYWPPSRWSLIR